MNPKIEPIRRKESLQEDGMLFVRSEGILKTMAKAPLILAGLIVIAIVMPLQTSFSFRTLNLTIYSDGSTHISDQIDIDPLLPDFDLELLGNSIDNFVAVGDGKFLLSEEIVDNQAIIETFGSSSIKVDYDIHDLVSKKGRVWTFMVDAPNDYSLVMPKNSVIVGMSVLPHNMELIDDQNVLSLKNGTSEINYIFGVPTNPTPTIPTNPTPTIPTNPNGSSFDYFTVTIIGSLILAGSIVTILMIKRKKSNFKESITQTKLIPQKQVELEKIDTESIFTYRPDMREDDKQIIKFISENGGKALESELRKKFLQPRTTMWRAVKRLERLGVIEIDKKDMQNLVKLKKIEDEEE